ncbi:hypothetical protein ACKWRH_31425 [Bradyrhizobium sp. Pa8]|uniref:hypothetical protein n=1 Tax=Bradyrhizobium sp. Pa8 TaxID=3386552 RepID=UPI00403F796F
MSIPNFSLANFAPTSIPRTQAWPGNAKTPLLGLIAPTRTLPGAFAFAGHDTNPAAAPTLLPSSARRVKPISLRFIM